MLFFTLMSAKASETEEEVYEALKSFISAFELGDFEAMEAAFARDAVTFPRSIMANGFGEEIEVSRYRRVRGIDPQMRELITGLQASGRIKCL